MLIDVVVALSRRRLSLNVHVCLLIFNSSVFRSNSALLKLWSLDYDILGAFVTDGMLKTRGFDYVLESATGTCLPLPLGIWSLRVRIADA